jgi:phospholipid/cholesterol/gamma-HCH transport system ATP-binding protein
MTTLFPPLISLIGSSSQPSEDVRFEGVGLKLGDQQILRGINLTLKRRETVAIVGESGCGKTTLLKLLIGLLAPTQGQVVFRGKSIAAMDSREQSFLRRHFGFLFQAAALFDSMSVADNIAFGLRAQGILPEKDILPIIGKMLSDVGLSPGVADKFPAELSGGMRKRVGLARALAQLLTCTSERQRNFGKSCSRRRSRRRFECKIRTCCPWESSSGRQ